MFKIHLGINASGSAAISKYDDKLGLCQYGDQKDGSECETAQLQSPTDKAWEEI
jgi:hypothetical protein